MTRGHILSIDQGTTNTKALVVDACGAIVARASRPVPIEYPQPAWVEHDAEALWRTVREAVDDCLNSVDARSIGAIAVSNQREAVVVWNRRSGKPEGPCISWQCRRTAPFCATLRNNGLERRIRDCTGLGIDPLFSASKARWLLDHIQDGVQRAAGGELCIGTVDSWIVWNLTGGRAHVCDLTNAARTQLLDLRRGVWSESMLEIFGIPRAALPTIVPSSGLCGECTALGRGLKDVYVASVIGDSHAAMFSHAALRQPAVKATYGTGSSLMMTTPELCGGGRALSSTIAWSMPGAVQYALEGNITVTGAAVEWLGGFLGLADPVRDAASLAESVNDSAGVYVVPAFAGLGAPYWDPEARGLVCGLTRGTTAAHMARATVESIAFQICDVLEAMQAATGVLPAQLQADGGATRNDALMQFQADIIGRPVVRNNSADLSAIGAAWLAGLATGLWADLCELGRLPRSEERFEPAMPDLRRERLYRGWLLAVDRARLSGAPALEENSIVHGSN